MSRAFMLNITTAQAVFGRFVSHVHDLAQTSGAPVGPVVPEDVWEHAIASFDWAAFERE
jgi:hypothetical protein